MSSLRKAVFLDRDGVLNRATVRDGRPYPPASIEELEILPGVAQALTSLKAAGFLLYVVTNQPDIARGAQCQSKVDEINQVLAAQLPIDEIYVCPHDDVDNCPCRKPKPGLMTRAAAENGIALAASYMVGDRWRDIDAGHTAGCTTIQVDSGYRDRSPEYPPDYVVKDLLQAANWIIERSTYLDKSTQ